VALNLRYFETLFVGFILLKHYFVLACLTCSTVPIMADATTVTLLATGKVSDFSVGGNYSKGDSVEIRFRYASDKIVTVDPFAREEDTSYSFSSKPADNSMRIRVNGQTVVETEFVDVRVGNDSRFGSSTEFFDNLSFSNTPTFDTSAATASFYLPRQSPSEFINVSFVETRENRNPNFLDGNAVPTSNKDLTFGSRVSAGVSINGSTPGDFTFFNVDLESMSFGQIAEPPPPPTPNPPEFTFPLNGFDQIFVNTVSGGKCAENIEKGCTDVFHTASQAYYSVDFDLNGSTDSADVVAAASGTIVATGGNGKCRSNNNCVVIDHGDGYYTEYRELSSLVALSVGDEVDLGEILGTVVAGKSLNDSGYPDHLHFQVLYDEAQTGSHLNAQSSKNTVGLADVEVGGVKLTNFSLAPNGDQGLIGLISATGDVSRDVSSVTGYASVSSFEIGESSRGQLIVNGPAEIVVGTDLTIGSSGYGKMYAVNGASVSADQILIGDQSGGQGYLSVSGVGTMVDGGDFVGVGLSSPASTTAKSGVAIVEVSNRANLKANTVGVGLGGSLRLTGAATIDGNVIVSGGKFIPGSSPGFGFITGDLNLESGLLELEREGSLIDQIFVEGSIFVGSALQIDWFGDFFDGTTVNIFDYLISDYLDDLTNPSILFEDVSLTASRMRLFTSDISNVGSSVDVDLGGYTTTLTSVYRAEDISAVPLPASAWLLLAGVFGLFRVGSGRKRRLVMS